MVLNDLECSRTIRMVLNDLECSRIKRREGHGARIWPKKHRKALISEYLAADLSADALAIINIG